MSTDLVVRENAAVANWTPSFAVGVDEAVAAVEAKREFFQRVMRPDEHYGKIPGTGKDAKPTLLKPGAELLLANMGLRPELSDADVPTIDYGAEGHEGLIRYRRICRIYRQIGVTPEERMLVAQAEGSCSSRESKYRWRNDQRVCPECGKPAIIKGKKEFGGGWLCFKRKDGCGAKFRDDDRAIVDQPVGKIANPDLADVENTILKMADKRALVAATLLATGCSDMFTQDVDDNERDADGRRHDAIDADFTEHRDETPAAPEIVDPTYVAELYRLMAQLNFDDERVAGAIRWASKERTTDVDTLYVPEASVLEKYLKREIDKAAETEIPL